MRGRNTLRITYYHHSAAQGLRDETHKCLFARGLARANVMAISQVESAIASSKWMFVTDRAPRPARMDGKVRTKYILWYLLQKYLDKVTQMLSRREESVHSGLASAPIGDRRATLCLQGMYLKTIIRGLKGDAAARCRVARRTCWNKTCALSAN